MRAKCLNKCSKKSDFSEWKGMVAPVSEFFGKFKSYITSSALQIVIKQVLLLFQITFLIVSKYFKSISLI